MARRAAFSVNSCAISQIVNEVHVCDFVLYEIGTEAVQNLQMINLAMLQMLNFDFCRRLIAARSRRGRHYRNNCVNTTNHLHGSAI